jgi:hypothetical protein
MSTFCLVHGAWHGAWCWERFVPELEALGHRAIAVDLPCDDPEVDFPGYARVVESAIEHEGDVVLVGHSLAGHTVPLVAANRPIAHLVFLCALLPLPGRSLRDQFGIDPDMLTPVVHDGVVRDPETGLSSWRDPDEAIASMYQDCDPEDARWAVAHLRPQAGTPHRRPWPLDAIPDIERTYIVAGHDNTVNPEWSRRAARARLGVTPVEIDGGHSPFLARPAELARLLDGLA